MSYLEKNLQKNFLNKKKFEEKKNIQKKIISVRNAIFGNKKP